MHWGQSLFVHFSLFFELKSDILFICIYVCQYMCANICVTWSHDFKIYCDWLPSICSLRLLRLLKTVGNVQALGANGKAAFSPKAHG